MSAPDSDLSLEARVLLRLNFTQRQSLREGPLLSLLEDIRSGVGTAHPRFTTTTAGMIDAVLVQLPDYSVWTRSEPLDLFELTHLKDHGFIDESDPAGKQLFASRH